MTSEASVFRVEGLGGLTARYTLYAIRGLGAVGSSSYHQKVNELVRRLSFTLKAPFTSIQREGTFYLAAPEGVEQLEQTYPVVGGFVNLKKSDETLELSFDGPPDSLENVRIRFLDFMLQHPLYKNGELWQPRAGKPFFFKRPHSKGTEANIFEGVSVRACRHPDGGFGIVCDARSKIVRTKPIGARTDQAQLLALVGRSCLYKMNDNWYQFRIDGVADVLVGDQFDFGDAGQCTLLQHLVRSAGNAAPQSVVNLDPEGAVLTYYTSSGQQRFAPAALCYLIEETSGKSGRHLQSQTILAPGARKARLQKFVRRYLSKLQLNGVDIHVVPELHSFESTPFEIPTLLFGQDNAVAQTRSGSRLSAVRHYSKERQMAMFDPKRGFFKHSALRPQGFMVPQSVWSSFGPALLTDLKKIMLKLYSAGNYDPQIVVYDDTSFGRALDGQWKGLLAAMETDPFAENNVDNVLVMLNRVPGSARRQDQLAAMVCNEFFRRFDKRVQVMHSDTPRRGYVRKSRNGEAFYEQKNDHRITMDGYLKGVALNKICLGNGRWPFVLKDPLAADMIIGMDVKNNMAVFSLVGEGGRLVRVHRDKSQQKEKLKPAQVTQAMLHLLREEMKYLEMPVRTVAIHRDGRAWPEEIEGIEVAFATLAGEGPVLSNVEVSVFELLKSSPAPMRLFSQGRPNDKHPDGVFNPIVGTWFQLGENDAYICTTGAPLLRQGTADPLHVRRVSGLMPMSDGVADIYALSCLTWPKPDGCMRDPISIKLCDITLFDEAATYDMDAVRFAPAQADEAAL
ncbi:hypothetical protein [Tateyamaria omphalii]|uniref:Piwi domain-containing protein n=1 Tax=Tateyamaria omphalii TaxID=299262 RepID=A0A1P8MQK5_9RHOB|nr:hypothetical protein [Tateyamaria omphalii]APX10273.1 hypothetical protein BWR18_00085 [Tateyamaria omphalii]